MNKKELLAGLFFLVSSFFITETQTRTEAQFIWDYVWTCKASSKVAHGIGISQSKSTAAKIALEECSMRTPMYLLCSIEYCK